MNLLIVAALVAVCGAAKLDRTYLPPASAKSAGGSPGSLQAPTNSFEQGLSAPKGSYNNDFQGVVVDAALAGTRQSGSEATGLGGPRNSYGSTASKVGDAAFRGSQAGFRFPEGFAREGSDDIQAEDSRPERPQAAQERGASTLRFDSEVGAENFNYAFETDNGISAEETGVATNGVQAKGGYSYTGDDGKVYSVTYTADEGGYQPVGDHLPTPPPIPVEILKSLEQNARDEAAGVIDDGLYDAQKYNTEGDYTESDSSNGNHNGRLSTQVGHVASDASASGSFINQNNLPVGRPNLNGRLGQGSNDKSTVNQFRANAVTQTAASGNRFSSRNEYLPPNSGNQRTNQNSRPQAQDVESSSSFQQEQQDNDSGNFRPNQQVNQFQSRPSSQASGSSSFGSRPNSASQSNGFQQQNQANRNQFVQNANNHFSSPRDNARPQFGAAPVKPAHQNAGRNGQSSSQSSSLAFNSQHSTSQPDTELTTPFESSPNHNEPEPSAPTNTNAFGSFNAQNSGRPSQSQFGSQNNAYQQIASSQAPAQPTLPSFTQARPQNFNKRPFGGDNQNAQSSVFSTQSPRAEEQYQQATQFNKRPQFSQNFQANAQFTSNAQNSGAIPQQHQGQDDSYYYNQPSRAFNTPSGQQQSSRFPSAPSNQFNRVTQRPTFSSEAAQFSDNSQENYPTSFQSQNGQQQGSTRYSRPPTAPTQASPASPRYPKPQSQPENRSNQFQSNAFASASNGITQASASSFGAPTQSTSFNRQQSGQFGLRQQYQPSNQFNVRGQSVPSSPQPGKQSFGMQSTNSQPSRQEEQDSSEGAQPLSQQPLQNANEPTDSEKEVKPVTSQQYKGEIYEYNKPAEALPPPPPGPGQGQFGQKMPSQSQTQSRPQLGQAPQPQQQNTRPQFGSQSSRFGQQAQPQENNFDAQTANTQEQSVENNFDAKPSRQQFGQTPSSPVNQFGGQRRPFGSQSNQGSFGSGVAKSQFGGQSTGHQDRKPCCQSTQESQNGQVRPDEGFGQQSQFGSQNSFSGGFNADQSGSQSVAGKGEIFGGPRKPPSFDEETGYHY